MAYDSYTQALQIIPLSHNIESRLLFNRAFMCTKLGRLHQAIDDCSGSLKINRTYYKAIVLRAKSYKQLRKYKECIRDYKAALKIKYTFDIGYEMLMAQLAYDKIKDANKRRRKTKQNYYQILKIKKTASDDDIRRAYKKQALIHHPDRHRNATDNVILAQTEIFKQIGKAYEILGDPRKRLKYDSHL